MFRFYFITKEYYKLKIKGFISRQTVGLVPMYGRTLSCNLGEKNHIGKNLKSDTKVRLPYAILII